MKAVVDTNVLAYHLLGTPRFAAEAEAFLNNAGEILAPAVWEAEIANVIWMATRTGVLPATDAPARLAFASRLGVFSVSIRSLWQGALMRSVKSGVAVYDTLFIELAVREQAPLVTFDRKLMRAFPGLAMQPREIAG